MELGIVTDSLASLPFDEMLDTVAAQGITAIELPTGGWSSAPHCDVRSLLTDAAARDRFVGAVTERGLHISALNINGNQLHPVIGAEIDALVHATVDLAAVLGVGTVVLMSGLPGGAPGDQAPNWVTTSWPPETQTILDYQWNEVAIPYWKELGAYGRERGVRFAVEMHGDQLVYNAATLLRLREAVGDVVGANFDPSHPMWMGADPCAMAGELTGAIYNVHAKDTRINGRITDVNGLLDTQTVDRAATRAWNYVTLGLGRVGGRQFWGQFLSDLRSAGYDGVLAIEHEDVLYDAVEGLTATVGLLREVMPVAPASWKPQDV
ncbi:sugar phosphate isomerase/epimerase [Actinomyces sp. MRS3W]|uniref:sugar phosphate isomerase/epimerase family protein n=1 Tax=Actinomyces sp. MRS3W TaxID=2800796 RepID=UPI0028FD7ED3|nr:sugar phosphate isomerase/epimerase [Actinomyces sp. MRS3W]MDU0347589.1 sugar phosphate isomerase/epimerase [Actinomyces sp. MRS3W]